MLGKEAGAEAVRETAADEVRGGRALLRVTAVFKLTRTHLP